MSIDPALRSLIDRAMAFHGHVGPYLVIGLRMARLATSLLGALERVHAEIELKPPHSCIIEGLQFFTGHTLCNGGLTAHREGEQLAARFTSKKRRNLRIAVRPSIVRRLRRVTKNTMHSLAMTLAEQPADALFTWAEQPA